MNVGRALATLASGTSSAWVGAVGARSLWTRAASRRIAARPVGLPTMDDVLAVDNRLWRGPTPSVQGYGELADAGVTLVVDLRSEVDLEDVARLVESFGMKLMALPTDNARAPQPTHVEQFARRHRTNRGITYIHCEAGEGRTGAIVGAVQVGEGAKPLGVLTEQLSVGSLTIAQMAYIASAGRRPLLVSLIDQAIDRPTEKLFDLAR